MTPVDIRKILKKHKAGWLALSRDNTKEIANGKTLHEVLVKAKAKGEENPSVLKVPNLNNTYVG